MSALSDEANFERTKAVLRGERVGARVPTVRKVLVFVLWEHGSNNWIHRGGFEQRWVEPPKRNPHGYVMDVAPGMVAEVMARMGVSSIVQPTVGLLDHRRATVKTLRKAERDHVAWVLPGEEEIQLMVRPVANGAGPEGMRIPTSGPWSLPPPLPPWEPALPTFSEFAEGLACPHCAATSTSYRTLDDGTLICKSCGRSFAR